MGESVVLKAIAREMQTGVLVLDSSGEVRYANPFFLECIGDVKSKGVGGVIRDKRFLDVIDDFVDTGGITSTEIEVNEGEKVYSIRMVVLTDSDGPGLLMFLRDTTEEKRVEAIKKDFVANVSHELRTPLASIKGYSETLLDGMGDDPETTLEFLRIIDKHATRMSRLIDDLLVLSRIESNQLPIEPATLDLCEFMSTVVSGFKKQAQDKGIELITEFREEPVKVFADRDRLEQVMVNLLDNAIKYTQSGGRAEVTVSSDGGEARVDVSDTGIGIPPEDLSRIFERFYRVDKARSRELGGTGLGLAIVKHIVQGINGRVNVSSVPGKGSCFSLFLKLREPLH